VRKLTRDDRILEEALPDELLSRHLPQRLGLLRRNREVNVVPSNRIDIVWELLALVVLLFYEAEDAVDATQWAQGLGVDVERDVGGA